MDKMRMYLLNLTQVNISRIRELLRVAFRDAGLPSDDVKINVVQIFKQLSPATEVKFL